MNGCKDEAKNGPSRQELDNILDDAFDELHVSDEEEKQSGADSNETRPSSSTSLPPPASLPASGPAPSFSAGARHDNEMEARLREVYDREGLPAAFRETMNSSVSFYTYDSWWRPIRETALKEGPGILNHPYADLLGNVPEKYNPNDPNLTLFMVHCQTPDFVLVDEMIMLGADTDKLTQDGESALFLCCSAAVHLQTMDQRGVTELPSSQLPGMPPLPKMSWLRPKLIGYERIVRRLLELGADPSAAPRAGRKYPPGLTPLHLACRAGSLGMVELLLAHGADPRARSGPDGRRTPEDALPREKVAAYRALLRRVQPSGKQPRPPRRCWCLSGEKFGDCHGQERGKPVRDEAFCPCKSGKRYARCCKKRGVVWREKRDDYVEVRTITNRNAVAGLSAWLEVRKRQIREEHGREPLPTDKLFDFKDGEDPRQASASFMNALVSAGVLDRAFAHVAAAVDFTPRFTRQLAKNEMLLRMREWNAAVDAYAAGGTDGRGAEELERELKVGPDHAPLRRRCSNAPACAAVEPPPPAAAAAGGEWRRFALCGRCKQVCYCSPECQRAHWKDGKHKKNCGSDEFVPLPGQAAMMRCMNSGPQLTEMLTGMMDEEKEQNA